MAYVATVTVSPTSRRSSSSSAAWLEGGPKMLTADGCGFKGRCLCDKLDATELTATTPLTEETVGVGEGAGLTGDGRLGLAGGFGFGGVGITCCFFSSPLRSDANEKMKVS